MSQGAARTWSSRLTLSLLWPMIDSLLRSHLTKPSAVFGSGAHCFTKYKRSALAGIDGRKPNWLKRCASSRMHIQSKRLLHRESRLALQEVSTIVSLHVCAMSLLPNKRRTRYSPGENICWNSSLFSTLILVSLCCTVTLFLHKRMCLAT